MLQFFECFPQVYNLIESSQLYKLAIIACISQVRVWSFKVIKLLRVVHHNWSMTSHKLQLRPDTAKRVNKVIKYFLQVTWFGRAETLLKPKSVRLSRPIHSDHIALSCNSFTSLREFFTALSARRSWITAFWFFPFVVVFLLKTNRWEKTKDCRKRYLLILLFPSSKKGR